MNTLIVIGIAIGLLFALAIRFPLFGWFLLGFINGLMGRGGRRW